MARATTLFWEGIRSYQSGELSAAAMQFRQAAETAQTHGDYRQVHRAIVWEADSHRLNFDYRRALSRAFDALTMEADYDPTALESHEQWISRAIAFRVAVGHPVNLAALEDRLTDLETNAARLSPPNQDLPALLAELAAARGDWQRALSLSEQSCAENVGQDGNAFFDQASSAFEYCLRLHRFSAARDWIAAIDHAPDRQRNFGNLIDQDQALARFDLARAEGAPMKELHELFASIDAVSTLLEYRRDARDKARMHLALLDPTSGDPLDRAHPARRALSRKPQKQAPATTYAYRLQIADWRVSCLRFAADLPPVDDEFHDMPEAPPVSSQRRVETLHRTAFARTAINGAMRDAVRLDTIFECDFRTQDVTRRTKALDKIVLACRNS